MPTAGREEEKEALQDGTCDACEPDEAQDAARLCQSCAFAFCQLHAGPRQKYGAQRMTLSPPGQKVGDSAETPQEGEAEGVGKQVQKRQKHGRDLRLYCGEHEEIICVPAAVTGSHRPYELIMLNDAYEAARNRECVDLKEAMLEMVKMQVYRPQKLWTLHLLDLQEALQETTEVLTEIDACIEKLMTKIAKLTRQLNTFNELTLLKPECPTRCIRCLPARDGDLSLSFCYSSAAVSWRLAIPDPEMYQTRMKNRRDCILYGAIPSISELKWIKQRRESGNNVILHQPLKTFHHNGRLTRSFSHLQVSLKETSNAMMMISHQPMDAAEQDV
ncbi:LOW QUALITY PROTEIN: tripartite motif-containing protein 44 [Liasis olivaceus]